MLQYYWLSTLSRLRIQKCKHLETRFCVICVCSKTAKCNIWTNPKDDKHGHVSTGIKPSYQIKVHKYRTMVTMQWNNQFIAINNVMVKKSFATGNKLRKSFQRLVLNDLITFNSRSKWLTTEKDYRKVVISQFVLPPSPSDTEGICCSASPTTAYSSYETSDCILPKQLHIHPLCSLLDISNMHLKENNNEFCRDQFD